MAAVAKWLERLVASLVLDLPVAIVVLYPEAASYLRWLLLGLYALLSWRAVAALREHPWIFRIVRDTATRIAHGLEHATMAVADDDGLRVTRGFTHLRNAFVIVLEAGHGDRLDAVRDAAAVALRRMQDGERSLAYQPGCGTSAVITVVSLWIAYVVSGVLALLIGGSVPIFLAIALVVFRIWLACETALGLLAQRLYTVSTAFTSATVVDVRAVDKVFAMRRPAHETWFEVVVDYQLAASRGGVVAPGALA